MSTIHPQVRVGPLALAGDLTVPVEAHALVLFAHGSGSSRHSPRNRLVAEALQGRRLVTLLFDLLGDEETDRPDLAGAALAQVRAPALLIVGALDEEVLALSRKALQALHCERRLEVVPRAMHLFEEAGALERVADLAGGWPTTHLRAAGPR